MNLVTGVALFFSHSENKIRWDNEKATHGSNTVGDGVRNQYNAEGHAGWSRAGLLNCLSLPSDNRPSDNTPTWHSSSISRNNTFSKMINSKFYFICKISDLGKATQWMVTSVWYSRTSPYSSPYSPFFQFNLLCLFFSQIAGMTS